MRRIPAKLNYRYMNMSLSAFILYYSHLCLIVMVRYMHVYTIFSLPAV